MIISTVYSSPAQRTKLSSGANTYFIRKGRLYHKSNGRKTAVEGITNASAIAFSCDMWRLYVADRDARFVYACTLYADGVPGARYKMAPIELPYDLHTAGCNDICVSDEDRVFAATELGVQSMRSFGINDIIIPLPDGRPHFDEYLDSVISFPARKD